MSEYQYYEFYSLNKPLTDKVRAKMEALSSRVKIGTHGASFVYNYGDFPAEPIKILSSYFDVLFYLSNFGSFRLVFKYPVNQVDLPTVKKYCFDDVISIHRGKQNILLDMHFCNEDGFGWCEGENVLPSLLPVYEQIKNNNYRFLKLLTKTHNMLNDEDESNTLSIPKRISPAERVFLECVGNIS